MSMRKFAEHIVSVAHNNGKDISNLMLQKVMFFSIGLYIRERKCLDELIENMYDVPFEKWKYGPVVESVYYEYNQFGRESIEGSGAESNEMFEDFNEIITRLLEKDVFQLVNLSHRLPSWANFEEEILNREFVEPYSLEEILKDFVNE